jgi:hypothetical protein
LTKYFHRAQVHLDTLKFRMTILKFKAYARRYSIALLVPLNGCALAFWSNPNGTNPVNKDSAQCSDGCPGSPSDGPSPPALAQSALQSLELMPQPGHDTPHYITTRSTASVKVRCDSGFEFLVATQTQTPGHDDARWISCVDTGTNVTVNLAANTFSTFNLFFKKDSIVERAGATSYQPLLIRNSQSSIELINGTSDGFQAPGLPGEFDANAQLAFPATPNQRSHKVIKLDQGYFLVVAPGANQKGVIALFDRTARLVDLEYGESADDHYGCLDAPPPIASDDYCKNFGVDVLPNGTTVVVRSPYADKPGTSESPAVVSNVGQVDVFHRVGNQLQPVSGGRIRGSQTNDRLGFGELVANDESFAFTSVYKNGPGLNPLAGAMHVARQVAPGELLTFNQRMLGERQNDMLGCRFPIGDVCPIPAEGLKVTSEGAFILLSPHADFSGDNDPASDDKDFGRVDLFDNTATKQTTLWGSGPNSYFGGGIRQDQVIPSTTYQYSKGQYIELDHGHFAISSPFNAAGGQAASGQVDICSWSNTNADVAPECLSPIVGEKGEDLFGSSPFVKLSGNRLAIVSEWASGTAEAFDLNRGLVTIVRYPSSDADQDAERIQDLWGPSLTLETQTVKGARFGETGVYEIGASSLLVASDEYSDGEFFAGSNIGNAKGAIWMFVLGANNQYRPVENSHMVKGTYNFDILSHGGLKMLSDRFFASFQYKADVGQWNSSDLNPRDRGSIKVFRADDTQGIVQAAQPEVFGSVQYEMLGAINFTPTVENGLKDSSGMLFNPQRRLQDAYLELDLEKFVLGSPRWGSQIFSNLSTNVLRINSRGRWLRAELNQSLGRVQLTPILEGTNQFDYLGDKSLGSSATQLPNGLVLLADPRRSLVTGGLDSAGSIEVYNPQNLNTPIISSLAIRGQQQDRIGLGGTTVLDEHLAAVGSPLATVNSQQKSGSIRLLVLDQPLN